MSRLNTLEYFMPRKFEKKIVERPLTHSISLSSKHLSQNEDRGKRPL